jgi:hypothetical protein
MKWQGHYTETVFAELLCVKKPQQLTVRYNAKCKHNVRIKAINSVVKSVQLLIIFALQISTYNNSSNHGI